MRPSGWRRLGAAAVVGGLFAVHAVLATRSSAAASEDPIEVVEPAVEVANGVASIRVMNRTGVSLSVTGGVAGRGPFTAADPNPVEAGKQATIQLALGDRAPDKDDRFLVIVAATAGLPDGWSTSLPFSDTKPAVARPAVTKWRTVDYAGPGLWFEDGARGRDIPLENEGGCDAVALDDTKILAWVQGEGRAASVSATCVGRDSHRAAARLRVDGLSYDGIDYGGAIDFNPDDDKSTTVDLTVRRTIKPSLFLTLLLLGIALAYLARWWTGSGKVVKEQQFRLAGIEAAITSEEPTNPLRQFSAITKAGGLTVVSTWNLSPALLTRLEAQKKALATAGRVWRPAGRVTKRYKDAEKALGDIEGVLLKWPSLANLLVRLRGLMPTLELLPALRKDVLAGTLDRSGPIDIEDVEKIREKAQLGIDVAQRWPAERARHVAQRCSELNLIQSGDEDSATRKNDAVAAWTRYEGLAADATTVDQVNEAARALYDAAGKIEAALRAGAKKREVVGAVAASGASAPPPTIHRDADINAEALSWKARLRVKQWVVDSLLVLAVLLVAVLSGMQALYIDKAVGGLWDYAAIASWGFASATVAEPVAIAIQRLADGLTGDPIAPPAK